MAGEIQLNSTTMATESSGSITAELDTIRPNTTNGSLTLQGDSSDAGVTGLTIDSSGAVNTTTAKVTNIQATSGQSLTIKDEDGNAAITIGTDNTAAGYLSLNFGSYHGDSGGAGSGTLTGNTLSDYEEGTFSCNFTDSNISVIHTQTGYYTKIGNLVTVSVYQASSIPSASPTGTITFTGLPFANSGYNRSTGVLRSRKSSSVPHRVDLNVSATIIAVYDYSGETQTNTSTIFYTNGGTSERTGFILTYYAS